MFLRDWNLLKTMVKKLIISRSMKVCWKIHKRLVKKKVSRYPHFGLNKAFSLLFLNNLFCHYM